MLPSRLKNSTKQHTNIKCVHHSKFYINHVEFCTLKLTRDIRYKMQRQTDTKLQCP